MLYRIYDKRDRLNYWACSDCIKKHQSREYSQDAIVFWDQTRKGTCTDALHFNKAKLFTLMTTLTYWNMQIHEILESENTDTPYDEIIHRIIHDIEGN